MARPIWRGALSFGLVTVPVQLFSAIEDHSVRFRQFERGTSDRIRYRRVNERTGKEVAYEDIVKGYETGDGEYVLVERQELDEIAPGRSKTIDVEAFVDLGEVEPMMFDRTYWLGPGKEESDRAYVLLRDALTRSGKAGVAKFVMRGREYLALVRAGPGDILLLDTLHFAADLRDPAEDLPRLPGAVKTRAKELDMAVGLIDAMSEDWRPEEYRDTYTERVRGLVEAKKAGDTVVPGAEPGEPTKVVDLFEALSRSVESSRRRGTSTRRKGKRAKAGPELSDLPKTDLDRLARERGIRGRSKMNRADLEKALKAS
ncbi:non-homologous end joining protein Ku [Amycolatopsis samaneae]|uniref:Non-homologous end joining protein Ku n=1 Tax=Amycolatopsis samaneae TaxID=664691 RepID=A0ABW5GNL5_9PSEU